MILVPFRQGMTFVAASLVLSLVVACDNTPIPLTPSPGEPCGHVGVYCPTQHSCCLEYETCGGEPGNMGTCPAGMCCDIGGGPGGLGARPMHKQRPLP